jgi:hypothetical protein
MPVIDSTMFKPKDDAGEMPPPLKGVPSVSDALYPQGHSVTVKSPKGVLVKLALDRLPEAMQKGYQFVDPGEIAKAVNAGQQIEDFTGAAKPPGGPNMRPATEGITRASTAMAAMGAPLAAAVTGNPGVMNQKPGESLAAVGSAIPGMMVPGGLMTRMAASTLGGAAGSMLDDPSDPMGAAGKGLEYGAMPEMMGSAVAAPVRRVFTGKLGQIPRTAAEWIEKRYTFPYTATGRMIKSEVEKEAKDSVGRVIGSNVQPPFASAKPMHEVGADMQQVIKRIGSPLFKEAAADAVKDLAAATSTIKVDTLPIKQEASRMLTEMQHVRMLAPGKGASTLAMNPKVAALLRDVSKLPDNMKFMDAFEIRKRWNTLTKEPEELIGREPKSMFSKAVHDLTTQMDNAVNNTRFAKVAWQDFRNMYKDGANVLDSHVIARILKEHPEKVASAVTDYTSARQVKDAVLGNAMKWGDPLQQQEARMAWKRFQQAYIQEQLDKGGVFKLSENLKGVGKEALHEIYGATPEGKQMVEDAMAIGDAVTKMEALTPARNMHMLYATIANLPSHAMSGILHNHNAAQMYLRGVTSFMRESSKPGVKKAGEVMYDLSPNLARSLSMIARAWVLSEETADDTSAQPSEQMRQTQGVQQ